MGIKFYDSNGKYWGEYDETRNLFIPSEETTTQTETQNSNSEFEKRTMRDCYNCKRYESEGECVECKYEPKQTDEPQTTDYCDVCNHKGCDNCIADGNNPYCVPSHYEPKDEPQIYCDTCGLNKKCGVAFTKEARHCQNESRFGKDEPHTEREGK